MLRLLQNQAVGMDTTVTARGSDTSEEAEMHRQRTRRRIAQVQRLTPYDELEARSALTSDYRAVAAGARA
ncbi:MAG TPA: hypothetical protein VK501_16340 [Baekduia sp.]|uniref:hypothetical protein n=1 Tax=Baekduia sp. TaxID=2600305 RepID=UPI002B86184C|nr:hypothetical protein [Baekduia sp.]HMJ35479.1 hypothetical protein [Baekduia sp.]